MTPLRSSIKSLLLFPVFAAAIMGCKSKGSPGQPPDPALLLKNEISACIDSLQRGNLGSIDSSNIMSVNILIEFYRSNNYRPLWIKTDTITPWMDSMIQIIQAAREFGLFPETYHQKALTRAKLSIRLDTLHSGIRINPHALATVEILLTDAFLTMARHIHRGHISMDSLTREKTFNAERYVQAIRQVNETLRPRAGLETIEPTVLGYQQIKKALPAFLRTADFSKKYTHVVFPYRDSLVFIRSLIERFKEDKYLPDTTRKLDSLRLAQTIRQVQAVRGLAVDGKYGRQLVYSLNNNDSEKFFKVAVSMDRYRMESDTLPSRYLVVNLPAYELNVLDRDTVRLVSRVIVGKPSTPTPRLKSRLNQIIVFPTWTIPASIVAAEILPALKRDPGYLARKGYTLYNYADVEIDPYSVDWSKYKKGIPYKIVQGEGIGNALGIMKFNFPNEHSVYLHDTNQRGLFKNENRSLSHGCVRVENWAGLYQYIIQQDSIKALEDRSNFTHIDSIAAWLKQQQKRVIPIKDQLPVFFRYYTAAGKEGKLETYPDIYGLDEPFRLQIAASQ